MSRTKTKRIVWTLAVLLALSFVAAIVLHGHDGPKIIGNLSEEDVSEISRRTLRFQRRLLRERMRWNAKTREIRSLVKDIKNYASIKVVSIEAPLGGEGRVTLGAGTNVNFSGYRLVKKDNSWKISPYFFSDDAFHLVLITNTAPVSQSSVGK
jgi:hypothetical protein